MIELLCIVRYSSKCCFYIRFILNSYEVEKLIDKAGLDRHFENGRL